MRSAGLARSLHTVKQHDLSVTTDERSSSFATWNHIVHKPAFLEVPLCPLSINRQVRLGDFLFTGE